MYRFWARAGTAGTAVGRGRPASCSQCRIHGRKHRAGTAAPPAPRAPGQHVHRVPVTCCPTHHLVLFHRRGWPPGAPGWARGRERGVAKLTARKGKDFVNHFFFKAAHTHTHTRSHAKRPRGHLQTRLGPWDRGPVRAPTPAAWAPARWTPTGSPAQTWRPQTISGRSRCRPAPAAATTTSR
jgi:hypothetical protein